MAKPEPVKAEETKYGVLFTNHSKEGAIVSLSANQLRNHPCKPFADIATLLQQEHSPLFEEVGLDFMVSCRNSDCSHQV